MRILGCQLDIVWENKQANLAKVQRLLEAADPAPGTLVVVPEMFATGFSLNVAAIGEGEPSETESWLGTIAQGYGIWMLAGLVRRGSDGRGRNEAVVFNPNGQLMARYAKIHPFSHGGETQHYSAGDEVVTFDWSGCCVAPFICYDLRFPEIFRTAVRRRAQLFAVLANWPARRASHWSTLLQARAIENQAYVVGVNRCGSDPHQVYRGWSVIIDPQGEVIADAGEHEGTVSAEVGLGPLTTWRAEFPALRDMRWAT